VHPQKPRKPEKEAWWAAIHAFEKTLEEDIETLTEVFGTDTLWIRDDESTALFFQIRQAFRAADINQNGQLDPAEVTRLLQKQPASVAMTLGTVEKTENGAMTFPAFATAFLNATAAKNASSDCQHIFLSFLEQLVQTQKVAQNTDGSSSVAVINMLDHDALENAKLERRDVVGSTIYIYM
jgi:hypothetical protein